MDPGLNSGINLLQRSSGDVICIAADLDNRKTWFRIGASGSWNGSGGGDPATNSGGLSMPSGTMVPFCGFGGVPGGAGNVVTANFGATAFVGAVPVGFTAGWPGAH